MKAVYCLGALSLAGTLVLAGCAAPGKSLGPADFTLQVAPEVSGPRQLLATVDPYASSSVGRIELELSDTTATAMVVATAALLPGDFHKVVTFARLRHHRQYTIEAEAYALDGTTILTAEATPVVVNVGAESAVGAATIAIRLRDRAFDGTGAASFPIASGTLTSAEPEAITAGPQWMVSTFSGSGARGYGEGAAHLARFQLPDGLAVATSGDLLVVDSDNHAIRRVDGSGQTTLLAGSEPGSGRFYGYMHADGDALSEALLAAPSGIAVQGNIIYVVDNDNNCIRRIENGQVTTLAGDPDYWSGAGYQDGVGTDAKFDEPTHLAIGPDGNLYVTDARNHRIRMVTPAGVVTTVAGDGVMASEADGDYDNGATGEASFNRPWGIVVAGDGTIYVADGHNHAIRQIAGGVVSTFVGPEPGDIELDTGDDESEPESHADGLGAMARFWEPRGLAFDGAGNLLVADSGNHCIRQVHTGTRQVKTIAGNRIPGFHDGPASRARFNRPTDVLFSNGVIYVSDQDNHRIRKIEDPALPTY